MVLWLLRNLFVLARCCLRNLGDGLGNRCNSLGLGRCGHRLGKGRSVVPFFCLLGILSRLYPYRGVLVSATFGFLRR